MILVSWTDVAQAVGAIVSGAVALIGFVIVIIQLRQLRRAVESDTHGRLYDQSFATMSHLMEHPELRPFFFERKEPPGDGPLVPLVMTYAELTADYLEHVVLQQATLPRTIWPPWKEYVKQRCEQSPVLVQYLWEHRAEYSDELLEILEDAALIPPRMAHPAEARLQCKEPLDSSSRKSIYLRGRHSSTS